MVKRIQLRDDATGDANWLQVGGSGTELELYNADGTAPLAQFGNNDVLSASITGAASESIAGGSALDLTLTGDVTSLALTGWTAGSFQRIRVQVVQDGTGGHAFDWRDVTGTWAAEHTDPTDTTAGAVMAQFYAVSTDGGTTVWLEPVNPTPTADALVENSAEASTPSFDDLEPATLSATTNDWVPPATTVGWTFTLGANRDLTGITAPGAGDTKSYWLVNLDTAGELKLKAEDAGSAAANRFLLPNAADVTIKYGGALVIAYVSSASRWMVIGQPG